MHQGGNIAKLSPNCLGNYQHDVIQPFTNYQRVFLVSGDGKYSVPTDVTLSPGRSLTPECHSTTAQVPMMDGDHFAGNHQRREGTAKGRVVKGCEWKGGKNNPTPKCPEHPVWLLPHSASVIKPLFGKENLPAWLLQPQRQSDGNWRALAASFNYWSTW